jgi:hypothetical protein
LSVPVVAGKDANKTASHESGELGVELVRVGYGLMVMVIVPTHRVVKGVLHSDGELKVPAWLGVPVRTLLVSGELEAGLSRT